MWHPSPIFRKLLLSALALIAVTLLTLDFYLTRSIAQRQTAAVRDRLLVEAQILCGAVPGIERSRLGDWVKKAASAAQARITVVDAEGRVMADSEHDPESMENHGRRPEIVEAYAGRPGFSIRHSATLGRDLCYLAVPLRDPGRPGWVFRIAVPLRGLNAAIAAVRWQIAGASLAAAAVALGMAFYFSRRFTRRVRRLQSFADGLLKARYSGGLDSDADDELGALALSLSRTAGQLRELIEHLRLESQQRETILASMAEGVLAVDERLGIIFCNDAFARAVGARAPIPKRLPVHELVRNPQLLQIVREVQSTGKPVKQRVELLAAHSRVFELQATPLATPEGPGSLVILHDITDLERLERIRKDFVANVSHELRTPLTAIRGYAETLLDGALSDDANNRKFLEVIHAHVIRLNNIASDLLALSELESGAPGAESERVSVRAALECALRTVEPEARIRQVRILCGALSDQEVRGSKLRLEQALLNLLSNAVRFNHPGGEVRVDIAMTENSRVKITIADTGIGIPSEDLPRIFERFYRVDKARSREVGGTGLGLSIVKHVVERMSGAVVAESELGNGSTFTVWLPALPALGTNGGDS